jgi:hypothetical protein
MGGRKGAAKALASALGQKALYVGGASALGAGAGALLENAKPLWKTFFD